MQRYFMKETYESQPTYTVTSENHHHMTRVMRMTPEDQVYLAFQDQVTIIAEIIEMTDEAVVLVERAKETQKKELPSAITIAMGYPKGDKLELVVQKGTELGAARFIGFPAKTSVVKWDQKKLGKKVERLTKIAQEAAEQSHRQVTPTVDLLTSSAALYEQFSTYDTVLVAYEEAAKQGELATLVQTLQTLPFGSRLLVIFGPEGGLTPAEVEEMIALGGKICGLGPRILRTETAPFYVLSAASYQWELATITN